MLAGITGAGLWWYYHTPEPTLLSFRIGQTFEEVVRNSTYPVMERSNLPADDDTQFGATWVTEPAVIVRFNDPKHGFTLPPTRFAALSYQHNVASTLATSPMLDKLPFLQAVRVLENMQNQFKAGGWEPYEVHQSKWFDLTAEGRKRLHAAMFEPPFYQQQTLRVAKKYAMTFRFLCAEGCWTREPPYLFLIDVGLSHDTYGSEPGDPPIWDKSHPANQATTEPAQPERAEPR
ncbi:MAG: hypothetical protein JWQ80_3026 [Massilia sp.]|nr:hypothetical protein [Massilia sp.]